MDKLGTRHDKLNLMPRRKLSIVGYLDWEGKSRRKDLHHIKKLKGTCNLNRGISSEHRNLSESSRQHNNASDPLCEYDTMSKPSRNKLAITNMLITGNIGSNCYNHYVAFPVHHYCRASTKLQSILTKDSSVKICSGSSFLLQRKFGKSQNHTE